ncbi:MAG TPA: SMP-30/gluconolactonase/LRE family protein [Acidimicrobiales bacterium]|jgi:sugar lactone lactonase YvrE|nr:SMP-30/gluconolactonase/LRE family protein [Acidimicrobiales bacterium]
MNTTEVVVDGLAFPECPRWRPDGLWFSDQHGGQIFRIRPGGEAEVMAQIPGGPSGLGWTPDGTLLAVSMHEKKLFAVVLADPDPDSGSAPIGEGAALTVVSDLGPYHPGLSNDMVVDASGRCYIGNIGYDIYGGEERRTTVLVLVDPTIGRGRDDAGASGYDRPLVEPQVVADDLMVPNGTVITPAGDRMIIAESLAQRLTSFRIAADGSLSDRQVFADLGEETPDGICLDDDGGIWFASVNEHQVVRVEEGGRVTDRIATSGRRAIACMLGGDDRRDLYVCATRTLDPNKSREILGGSIEVCRVDVPGAGLP